VYNVLLTILFLLFYTLQEMCLEVVATDEAVPSGLLGIRKVSKKKRIIIFYMKH
jgi:hypothetical protein